MLKLVLILVLVDVGLGLDEFDREFYRHDRLNPCFSGCWSRTFDPSLIQGFGSAVLILVLVDVGLGPGTSPRLKLRSGVLILVLVDVGLGLGLSEYVRDEQGRS